MKKTPEEKVAADSNEGSEDRRMIQPNGLQTDLLKCSKDTREWIMWIVLQSNEYQNAVTDLLLLCRRIAHAKDADKRSALLTHAVRIAGKVGCGIVGK